MLKINSLESFDQRCQTIIDNLHHQLIKHDISKLNLLILEDIYIDYFGTKTMVKFLVKVSRQKSNEVELKPFDPKLLKVIYQALIDYQLDLQIILVKDTIYLKLPVITSEKKAEIIKIWAKEVEQAKVQIRQARHQFINYFKNELKVSKEELVKHQKEIQTETDQQIKKVEDIFREKTIAFRKV